MWIQTYTGRKFYPLDPRPDDVCLEDIAHALAMKCRYAGHCREFFSVAQHSVMVSKMLPPYAAKWGLLHDAAEAYLPDICRPIKGAFWIWPSTVVVDTFTAYEDQLLKVIGQALGLPWPVPGCVAKADLVCLERERRQLMGPPPEEWDTAKFWDGCTTPIPCWSPKRAEAVFLDRFESLWG